MSTDITTRKRMTKYKESKTNTNVEIIRWESYMITYICVIEQLIKNRMICKNGLNFKFCRSVHPNKILKRQEHQTLEI